MDKLMILAEKTEDGRWVVWAQGIDTHGDGDTICDAIEDYADSLFFYIQEVCYDNPNKLGPHLIEQRNQLKQLLDKE